MFVYLNQIKSTDNSLLFSMFFHKNDSSSFFNTKIISF
ncbi:hypothetical protein NY10_506 [Carnobacterium antarcticum]|nr:hypothetical protein NY10_506 [Carnobacterium sp. CP1]